MSLARVWTRQLYGAWGVALLAPVTMIVALVVLALSGGFGGLSALGQLVSGPAVPAATNLPGGQVVPRATPELLPLVPASTAPAAPATRAPTRLAVASPRVPSTGGSGRGASPGGGGGERVGSGGGRGTAAPISGAPGAPTQPAPPVSTPSPPPAAGPLAALVGQVVAAGVTVTNTLPAPLAAIGTGTLQSLGQTLNTLLAPLP